jgi:glycosyltransferase involved in cell wall biosynthesis
LTLTLKELRLAAYTDSGEVAGAEQSLATLLAHLGPHVRVTILAVDEGVARFLAGARPGTETVLLPEVRGKADLARIAAHLRAVRRLRPNVLHANLHWPWDGQYGVAAGLATRGVRTIAMEHAGPLDTVSRLQRRLKRAASLRLSAHVCASRAGARELERLLDLPAGSIRTIPNGVPEFDGEPVPAPVPGPIIGSVGRLAPEKGFDLLVRAMAGVPEASLVLVGDGPERASLERLAAELGIADRVVITGWRDDARAFLPSMDLFVLPSHLETTTLSVIEAMLARRAVVVTEVGGLPELVEDGVSGLLVPPADPDALTAAIRRLLGDPGERERLASGGLRAAHEQFGADAMARRFEALYDEVT